MARLDNFFSTAGAGAGGAGGVQIWVWVTEAMQERLAQSGPEGMLLWCIVALGLVCALAIAGRELGGAVNRRLCEAPGPEAGSGCL